MKKIVLKSSIIVCIGASFLYGNASQTAFHKQQLDKTLVKIEKIAKEGKAKKFPSTCAKTDSTLLKYR